MIGQHLGNYRLMRVLGEGGMGKVYEVIHEQLGRRAAIKMLRPEFARSPEVAARFLNEARAVNIIQHPGIVSIFDWGQLPDGAAYIVMEYLEGETWGHRFNPASQQLALDSVLRLTRQVASALHAAHGKNIVHRELFYL